MAESKNGIIELENTGRDVFHFPIVEIVGPDKVAEIRGRRIIGDSADRICAQVDEDLRDHAREPSPIVRWSKAEYDELGPVNQKVLHHYIKNGTIRVTQGRELIGA